MRGKQVKKLKEMAAIFCQAQPKHLPQKSVQLIYSELKQLHKNKSDGEKNTRIKFNTD